MDKYIITVESGGTKSHISVFDYEGSLAAETHCGGVGSVGDADLTEFMAKINALDIPFDRVSDVIVNLGGTNDTQLQEAIAPLFPNGQTEVYRESSGVIMKAICEMEGADVLLMAGTGTICLAKGNKGCMIADGWGINIGDKGSGYWIGMETVSRSLIAMESGGELFPLAGHITGRTEPIGAMDDTQHIMKIRDEVRRNFLPAERAKIAGFAKDAARFAGMGDKMAQKIFHDAGICLAQTVIRASDAVCPEDNFSLLVSGGLTNCYDLWGSNFEQTLSASVRCNVRVGEADMTKGMLYYIKNMKRGV